VQFSVGHASWRWIVEDKVAEGRAEATRAMKVWSGRSYQVEHYYELIAQTMFDLYEGDAARAHERIVAQWAPLRGSLLLLVQAARVQMKYMRAHAAIVLARETPEGARRAGLLAAAARDTRALGREGAPWALAFAKVARAGLEAAKGRDANDARLVSLLREAIAESEGAGMALNATGAKRALGQVLGGDEGAAMVRAADAWMRAETIVSPERVAALIVPGFAR
jgi:eukaryotic-like serine/threonine-protein kinase